MESRGHLISIGSHVELVLVDWQDGREQLSFDIVPDEAADYSCGFLGASTPLAQALLGESTGTVIPYLKDDIQAIEILSVRQATQVPDASAEEKRSAAMRKNLREVEHASAVAFASSFSGKWGDYDPASLPEEKGPPDETPSS